jgi:hypothetical protein
MSLSHFRESILNNRRKDRSKTRVALTKTNLYDELESYDTEAKDRKKDMRGIT